MKSPSTVNLPIRLLVRITGALAAASLFAAAPPDLPERLRRAIRIPAPDVNLGLTNLSVNVDGVAPLDPPEDEEGELRRLQRLAEESPLDGTLQQHLGAQLKRMGRTNEAAKTFAKKEQLLRDNLKAHPDDALAMARLGYELDMKHRSEGEQYLRKAVVVGANRWECHLMLGSFLHTGSVADLAATNASVSEEALSEPFRHFDRAVALAGDRTATPLLIRAFAYLFRSSMWPQVVKDPTLARKRILEDMRRLTESLRSAERLEPDDYRILALRYSYEATLFSAIQPEKSDRLPETGRQALAEGVQRLTALAARSPNPRRTAEIWSAAGMLELLRGDPAAAEATAERALRLNPLHRQAWELRLGVLLGFDDTEVRVPELLALLERPRPNPESGRTRLMAARAYQVTGQLEKAAAEVAAAKKSEPDNLRVLMADFCLRLQRARTEGEALLADAKHVNVMERIAGELRNPANDQAFRDECLALIRHNYVTGAIRTAMWSSLEQARQMLAEVPESDRGSTAEYFATVETILASVPK